MIIDLTECKTIEIWTFCFQERELYLSFDNHNNRLLDKGLRVMMQTYSSLEILDKNVKWIKLYNLQKSRFIFLKISINCQSASFMLNKQKVLVLESGTSQSFLTWFAVFNFLNLIVSQIAVCQGHLDRGEDSSVITLSLVFLQFAFHFQMKLLQENNLEFSKYRRYFLWD